MKLFGKKVGYYIDEINGKFRLNRIIKEYDNKEDAKEDLFAILAHELTEEEVKNK